MEESNSLTTALNWLIDKSASLPEKYFISDGSGVRNAFSYLKSAIPDITTSLEIPSFIMEVNRAFSVYGLLELRQGLCDMYSFIDYRYIFPNRPNLDEETKMAVARSAEELIEIIANAILANNLYLNLYKPIGNIYRIGGYDEFTIHLYKTNIWSINHE